MLRSMTVLFDADVSGQGIGAFSATRVNYLLFNLLEAGPEVRPFSARDSDYLGRIGWITLGVDVDIPGQIEAIAWRAPWWLNFVNTEVSGVPQTDSAANDFGIWATHARWSLTEGTEGHLFVYGV